MLAIFEAFMRLLRKLLTGVVVVGWVIIVLMWLRVIHQ